MKEKAKWFHVTEQEHGEEVWLDYYIGEGGLVAVSLLQRSPEAFVNAEYLYRNDRPFSVNVYGGTAHRKIMKRQENIGLFGNRTVRYLMRQGAGKSGKMFMIRNASGVIRWPRYIWRPRDVANDEQKVWDFREESNRIASNSARLCVSSEYAGIDARG